MVTVFEEDQRGEANRVLGILLDARLLVAYGPSTDEESENEDQRIEIVHESLLTNWPRLVRWQSQDSEGAKLRDELRQAARTWDQHERSDDLLWTGTAFKEYEVWRERYPGGLTDLEEAFGEANFLAQIVVNAGFNPLEKVEDVIAAQSKNGAHSLAIDCDTGEVADMVDQGVLDPAPVKIHALKAASEVAEAILRINTIIRKRSEEPPTETGTQIKEIHP